jgi:aryl-alcohol dehydrogenase-like predicted oxidoreductase
VVATKFGHQFHPQALRQAGRSPVQLRTDHWTPAEVVGELKASLQALRTDHVDLYQMHSGSLEVFGRHDLWEALHQQVAQGKIRHLGVSLGGGELEHLKRLWAAAQPPGADRASGSEPAGRSWPTTWTPLPIQTV